MTSVRGERSWHVISIVACRPGSGLPIGYVGLSLGSQDPRGPPTNCSKWKCVRIVPLAGI